MKRIGAKPVTMPERHRMRALRAEGLTYRAIGHAVGRSWVCARVHTLDVKFEKVTLAQASRLRRLTRMERFAVSCNRALAEARA
ncbi:hypothetical protein [Methylorubrum suomiense]|uniref:Uncharacterized protein n=1 Tax=Methylorubrum suomiense TaxID=144191 RepID=A0ABQ4UYN0_9HYPH|nr:hypothetical protein [Methylorubrum suomiense]GJE77218.1 hypothetical protein BGCPKDLD_3821 [Methylorubrum suomiense]